MVKKKYSGEKEIKDKIQALFSYRKLTELLQQSQLSKDKDFVGHLVDIQFQIYLLDAYLEGQWDMEKARLKSCWDSIRESLSKLNYSPAQIDSLLSEIKVYERIERDCRKGKWPTRISFRKFYTTKSCDVRLMRHLIYDACPELKASWKENAWETYDLITEINDDIADIAEDLTTYNANRFLISVLRKGNLKTAKQYHTYILKITARANDYFKKHLEAGESPRLLEWTLVRSQETLELLESTIAHTDPNTYASSLLLEKMN
jgi:hypothetical protein